MARYECTLSSELLEKAVTELNEPRDNEERLKAIDELRNSYNADKFGPLVKDDDAFILRFLRARKFNQKRALTVLENYHSTRSQFDKVFDKVHNPSMLQPLVDKGVMMILEGDANDGSAIFLYRPGMLRDVDKYDAIAYSILALEKILENEKYQICGVCSLEDMRDFNLAHFLKVSPIMMAKLNSIWQDAMPIRFKAVHMVNEGKVIDVIVAIIKPFMKAKLMDRIHVHGTKYSGIHEYINPGILPPYLEGTGPDPETAAKIWNDKLTDGWAQDATNNQAASTTNI